MELQQSFRSIISSQPLVEKKAALCQRTRQAVQRPAGPSGRNLQRQQHTFCVVGVWLLALGSSPARSEWRKPKRCCSSLRTASRRTIPWRSKASAVLKARFTSGVTGRLHSHSTAASPPVAAPVPACNKQAKKLPAARCCNHSRTQSHFVHLSVMSPVTVNLICLTGPQDEPPQVKF